MHLQKQAYMEDKYNKIQEHLEEIDQLLNEKSTGWKTKRMGRGGSEYPSSGLFMK